jgi:hypothetical protein
MRTYVAGFAVGLGLLVAVGTRSSQLDPNAYGALAFSHKTGRYGQASNHPTRAEAERAALARCAADDAAVLTWVKSGWAALLIADGAYGYAEVHGEGASREGAYAAALKSLREHSGAGVKTAVVICSGDKEPTASGR